MQCFNKGPQMFIRMDTPPSRKLDFVNIEGQTWRDENINIIISQGLTADECELRRVMSTLDPVV